MILWARDPERVLFARRLWEAGDSAKTVATKCSEEWHEEISKNSIVGASHRGDWGSRPSPIRRDVVRPVQEACPPPGGYSQTSLPSLPSLTTECVANPLPALDSGETSSEPPLQHPTRLVRDPNQPLYRRDGTGCLAVRPIDDPKDNIKFTTCDRPLYSVLKPFCEECAKRYYLKPGKTQDHDAQAH